MEHPPHIQPKRLTGAELIGHLKNIITCIENGDSFGGGLEYEAAGDFDGYDVVGCYRTGNSQGQGGMILIHDIPVEDLSPEERAASEHRQAMQKVTAPGNYAKASKLPPLPDVFPVKELTTEGERKRAGKPCQCGTCGRWWDDEISTSLTPVPSGRCPFEYYHADPEEKPRIDGTTFQRIVAEQADGNDSERETLQSAIDLADNLMDGELQERFEEGLHEILVREGYDPDADEDDEDDEEE